MRKFEAEKHDYLQGQIGNPGTAVPPIFFALSAAYASVCKRRTNVMVRCAADAALLSAYLIAWVPDAAHSARARDAR